MLRTCPTVWLALLAILLGVAAAQSQQPPASAGGGRQSQQQQTQPLQHPTAPDQRGTEQMPLVVKPLPTPKTEEEAVQDARERDQKAALDRSLVKFTYYLVIIGGFQLAVFIGQLIVFGLQARRLRQTVETSADQGRDMKRSVAESARAATAMEHVAKGVAVSAKAATESVAAVKERTAMQMRAYLTVVVGTAVYQERAKDVRFEGKPALVNTGNTPAHKVGFRAKAGILPFPLPDNFDFTISTPWVGASILGPHQNFTLSAMVADFVDEAEVPGIKSGTAGKFLHVWGTVTYEDVFGESRYTNFYQALTWVPGPQGEIIWGVYPGQHNDAN